MGRIGESHHDTLPCKVFSFMAGDNETDKLIEHLLNRKREQNPDWLPDLNDDEAKKSKEAEIKEEIRQCKVVASKLNEAVAKHQWEAITVNCLESDATIVNNVELCFKWRVVLFRDLDNKVDVDAMAYTHGYRVVDYKATTNTSDNDNIEEDMLRLREKMASLMGKNNRVILKNLNLYDLEDDSKVKVQNTIRGISAVNSFVGSLVGIMDVSYAIDPKLQDRFLSEDEEATKEQKDDEEEVARMMEDREQNKLGKKDDLLAGLDEEEKPDEQQDNADVDPDAVKEEPKETTIRLSMNKRLTGDVLCKVYEEAIGEKNRIFKIDTKNSDAALRDAFKKLSGED